MDAIDVLMCVGSKDINRLFSHSLQSCLDHFDPLGHIYIVSDVPQAVLRILAERRLESRRITVLADQDVLSPELHSLPGWSRQQAIKLFADTITRSEHIACLGADTILLQHLSQSDLVSEGCPILYFNRYPHTDRHLQYERRRVQNVARLLGVEPIRALPLGDFIMDLNVFERSRLTGLRSHLRTIHGDSGLLAILPRQTDTDEDKVSFGEWSLYAVYLLDVVRAGNEICNSASMHLAQVHSQKDLQRFSYDSKIVHFVNKDFDVQEIIRRLSDLHPAWRLIAS